MDKAALTFTTTDWATAQTVTVTAQADDDPERRGRSPVTLSAAGVGALATVTVTVTDDDLGVVVLDADASTPELDAGPMLLDPAAVCLVDARELQQLRRLPDVHGAAVGGCRRRPGDGEPSTSVDSAKLTVATFATIPRPLTVLSALTFSQGNWNTARSR